MRLRNLKYGVGLVAVCLVFMGAASDCEAPKKSPGGAEPMNVQDGKHTITEIGKWKYGTKMEPSPNYPQCRWEIWGLQNDGWQQLYKGHGIGKVKLPPKGVYKSAYLKSTSCGNWDPAKK